MDFGHGGMERCVPGFQFGMRGEVRRDKLTDLGQYPGFVDRLQAAVMEFPMRVVITSSAPDVRRKSRGQSAESAPLVMPARKQAVVRKGADTPLSHSAMKATAMAPMQNWALSADIEIARSKGAATPTAVMNSGSPQRSICCSAPGLRNAPCAPA